MTGIKKIISQLAKAIIVVSLVIVYFNWLPKTLIFFVKGWFVYLIFHFLWRTLYRREHSLQSAQALFITICLAIVIYYWYSLPKSLILFAAGCLVYLIFRFLWRNLYRLGHNRIFILGIFALLPIFIIAFIVHPGDMRQWHLYIGKYITNFPYFTSYFDSNVKEVNGWLWLWHKADKYILSRDYLALSLFFGVLFYATNIELGNTQIKRNDLADPQTTAEHLNCHDDTWKTAFDILTVIALALNSLELAGFYFFYLLLTSDFLSSPTTSLIIDAIVLSVVLVFSFTRLDVWLFFTMPDLVRNYFSGKEHWESWCELFSPFKCFIYNGMLIILALPLAVRIWFKLIDRQKVKKLDPTG